MPQSVIKNLLKQDFGMDLDISGGLGQSRDDPIVVLCHSDSKAAHTELLVLRGLGKGRRVLWRSVGTHQIPNSAGMMHQIGIETERFGSSNGVVSEL